MMYPTQFTLLNLLALSPLLALARTDLSGCTSFTSMVTVNPTAQGYGNVYPSVVYYVPDTLEICTIPDCGGGRAPPKTGVPGCPLYSGTATPTPSFLSADPLAPPPAATLTVAPGGEASDVAAESLSVAAADETQDTSATEATVHALMSSSATATATATAATVTSSLVLVNVSATGTSTGRSAPKATTGVGPMGINKGNATGAGNGTGAAAKGGAAPGSSVQTTSYGDVLRVTVGFFSAAIALAAAFVL